METNMTNGTENMSSVTTNEQMAVVKERKARKPLSAETRARMSAAKKGHVVSVETRAKMSAAKKGRKVSEETRARMVAAHQARKARMNASQGSQVVTDAQPITAA